MNKDYYIIECNSNTSGDPTHDRWFEWYHHDKRNFPSIEEAITALKLLSNSKQGCTSDFRIVRLIREVVHEEELCLIEGTLI
jgi:hypothetical protein